MQLYVGEKKKMKERKKGKEAKKKSKRKNKLEEWRISIKKEKHHLFRVYNVLSTILRSFLFLLSHLIFTAVLGDGFQNTFLTNEEVKIREVKT